jgi:DNA-3-methyladenine glycosylase
MGRADALKPGRGKDGHLPLARSELPIDTVSLARYLIGKVLVRELPEGVASGRIVETEAYVVGDAAGHAYRVESRCGAVVLGRPCRLPPLSSGGALVGRP